MYQPVSESTGRAQFRRKVIVIPDRPQFTDYINPRHITVKKVREAMNVADLADKVLDVHLHYVAAEHLYPMLWMPYRHDVSDVEISTNEGRVDLLDKAQHLQRPL